MSGPAASAPLTPSQRAVMNQIISYGRANGFNDYQIDIAVKTAYIESKLGKELGPNPKGTASGLFGYIDDNWDQGYGKKDNNSNQIRAFYDDLADFTWRYYDQPYGPIPTKDVSLAEYVYIKHHDGRYKPPSANSVGKRISDHEPFEVPAGKNPPAPYKTPSTSSTTNPSSYVYSAGRPNLSGPIDPAMWHPGALPTGQNSATPNAFNDPPGRTNALGPIPAMWDSSALPTGQNRLAGDSPLNLPPASAYPPFQYSPSACERALFPCTGCLCPYGLSYLAPAVRLTSLSSQERAFRTRTVGEPLGTTWIGREWHPGSTRIQSTSAPGRAALRRAPWYPSEQIRNVFGPCGRAPISKGPPEPLQRGSRNFLGPYPESIDGLEEPVLSRYSSGSWSSTSISMPQAVRRGRRGEVKNGFEHSEGVRFTRRPGNQKEAGTTRTLRKSRGPKQRTGSKTRQEKRVLKDRQFCREAGLVLDIPALRQRAKANPLRQILNHSK